MKEGTVYQRTDSGRGEIRNKSHGLTQSERLALLLIDGVASYGGLCLKLTGVNPQRLERALLKLVAQGLAAEVLLPPPVPLIEKFDDDVIDRFLQQDVLDPVTVIGFDAESDDDVIPDQRPVASTAPPPIDLESWIAPTKVVRSFDAAVASSDFPVHPSSAAGAAIPDILERDLALLAAKLEFSSKPAPPAIFPQTRQWNWRWEFWFIGFGLVLIVISAALRYLR